MLALWPFLTSRIGLLVIAFVAVIVFYEGIPVGPLRIIPGVEALTDGRVDRERRAAREGYVQEVRAIAAEAKAAELERQIGIARRAADWYQGQLAAAQALQDIETEAAEQRIADYEKQLAAASRTCALDQSDLDFLRQ